MRWLTAACVNVSTFAAPVKLLNSAAFENVSRYGSCSPSIIPSPASLVLSLVLSRSFSVNRCIRVLRSPGKPLYMDSVQPGEHRTAADAATADVPAAAGSLVDEGSLRILGIDIESPRPESRQAVGRCGPRRIVPEHHAPRLVDHPGLH